MCLCVCVSVCPRACLPACLSVPSVCRLLRLSVCLSVCLPACLAVWLSVCSVCVPVCASVCASVSEILGFGLSVSDSVCLCLSKTGDLRTWWRRHFSCHDAANFISKNESGPECRACSYYSYIVWRIPSSENHPRDNALPKQQGPICNRAI